MQPEENTVFNTFVCIEAGVKEIYVTVFRNDKPVISRSYPYGSSDLKNGKAIGMAFRWFGKDIESNQDVVEEDGVSVYVGEQDYTVVAKTESGYSSRSASDLIVDALEMIKSKIDEESKNVFKDPDTPFTWKNTKVGITSRTNMTFPLKAILEKVFGESYCDAVFVNHCLTTISGYSECHQMVGSGVAADPVKLDCSSSHPSTKTLRFVDSAYKGEKKEDEIIVTPERVAYALNDFMKNPTLFNDVDPIQISLIGMGSSICFFDNKILKHTLHVFPPMDPCTSMPLYFELYAKNTKVREVMNMSIELSKELCLPREVIKPNRITLSFAYSRHVLTVTYVYDKKGERVVEAVFIPLPKSFVENINTRGNKQ